MSFRPPEERPMKINGKKIWKFDKNPYLCDRKQRSSVAAEIAQLVEHNLAKVGVASSSLVFRSKEKKPPFGWLFSLEGRRLARATPIAPFQGVWGCQFRFASRTRAARARVSFSAHRKKTTKWLSFFVRGVSAANADNPIPARISPGRCTRA